jgi:hypothetical protein
VQVRRTFAAVADAARLPAENLGLCEGLFFLGGRYRHFFIPAKVVWLGGNARQSNRS